KALPNTRVLWRRGAMLGVRGDNHDLGAVVNFVEPESAAKDAGIEAFDVIGPSDSVPDTEAAASFEQYERARIESGVPAMGRELTDATIPAESGVVPRSVSFTTGCFTGQELVARIDSRGGNVPRPLRLLRAEVAVPPGARLALGGRDVGVVTSSASTADGSIALALVARAVEPPAEVKVSWAGGETEGRVDPLPAQP
ncbi:MAG: hypothetical protein EHM63_09675, partial [Actinobacteria bacterium]